MEEKEDKKPEMEATGFNYKKPNHTPAENTGFNVVKIDVQ